MHLYIFISLISFPFICIAVSWSSLCYWGYWCPCSKDKQSIINGLAANISKTLFGQHLVAEPIISSLTYHLDLQVPKKALVFSFIGPTGVGKTFVARKIAHHFFDGNQDYVKFYSGRNDFHEIKDINEHKVKLSNEIKETVIKCPNAIFIFDEADKMADGLFDVFKPFIDYHHEYQGVDYRRTIFIFISNIGSSEIAKIYYQNKEHREKLAMHDFENALSSWLYNKPGGFRDSTLIEGFLIDWFIPFLPLDEIHINECISLSLRENNIQPTTDIIREIYSYLPKRQTGNVEYVPSNCKKIYAAVGNYKVQRERLARHKIKDEM